MSPSALENKQSWGGGEYSQGGKLLNVKLLRGWGGSWIKRRRILFRGQRSQEVTLIITREGCAGFQFK